VRWKWLPHKKYTYENETAHTSRFSIPVLLFSIVYDFRDIFEKEMNLNCNGAVLEILH